MVSWRLRIKITIKQLDRYKDIMAQLGDPRKITKTRAANSSIPPSRSTGS